MKSAGRLPQITGLGIFAGAFAWALHQLANYLLAGHVCTRTLNYTVAFTCGSLCLIILGSLASWRALQGREGDGSDDKRRSQTFMASVGMMACLLFLFAIFLQAIAPFFIAGCAT
jgi:hypothetical protein